MFPCLDYPLELSISWIYLLSPYKWFCHFCTSHHLMPLSCSGVYVHDTVFNACFWFRFIDTRVLVPARHLAFITPLIGEFLTTLDLHVQIPELGLWWTSRWSEWRSGSIVDQWKTILGPYPSWSPACPSSFSFVTRKSIVLFIILYLFVFSLLHLSVM